MKVFVPEDHGATDVLKEESSCVVVRPHKFDGDTYVPLWYLFQASNDSAEPLERARIVIEGLASDVYVPYWKHSVWSLDGEQWDRIPDANKSILDSPEFGTLTVETPLAAGEGRWFSIIFPLTYAWYLRLSEELTAPGTSQGLDWTIERRKIGDSNEGRPIYAFQVRREVRNGNQKPKRNLLIVAGQHAVEESGKMLAEDVLRGYHGGGFQGTVMDELLQTHNVTVVPVANPDGCYHGRMNSNALEENIWLTTDNTLETQALLKLIDELEPHVQVNCHGWGNEIGELPHEDIYRFTDEDPLFLHLREHVPGCSSSGTPHLLDKPAGRIEWHARDNYSTHCTVVEVNYHWYLPEDGGPPRQPTREDIGQRIWQYLAAIAGFCVADTSESEGKAVRDLALEPTSSPLLFPTPSFAPSSNT